VLALVEREPGEPITIGRVAAEVEAVPAALYRHFDNLDDVLDAVLTRVLETNRSNRDESAPWEQQLAEWMQGLRAHLLQYPAVLTFIDRSDRTSPAWLEASSELAEILTLAGLSGANLASTYLWILEMTNGMAMVEAMMPLREQLANARASHGELSERARARFEPILSGMKKLDGDALFSFVVAQVVSAVASLRDA